MQAPVYRVMTLLCGLVAATPVGTNLGLVQVLWAIMSGRLLATRGAIIPALALTGLPARVVRRAWAAAGSGRWTVAELVAAFGQTVAVEGHWHPHRHGGYQPVAVDVTAINRPRLQHCPSRHFDARAGKAVAAIVIGLVVRVGQVGTQRVGVPLAVVRADPAADGPRAHDRTLVRAAVAACGIDDALVLDAGFHIGDLQAAGAGAWVVRLAKNATAQRRAHPAPTGHRGRPRTRGALVRPLARTYGARTLAASPPDAEETWTEDDGRTVRAQVWTDLQVPGPPTPQPPFRVVAVTDPRWPQPLLLASSLAVSARDLRDLYADRWAVEQVPLVAKQLLGAGRQFVWAPESCQRLPELALLAGAVLSYAAATLPACATGFWDRRPRPTAGRLRRQLAQVDFPHTFPFGPRFRQKQSVTAHLSTGYWGQRPAKAVPDAPAA